MIKKLKILINDWEEESQFLNCENDSPTDKAAGVVYAECAHSLRDVLSNPHVSEKQEVK